MTSLLVCEQCVGTTNIILLTLELIIEPPKLGNLSLLKVEFDKQVLDTCMDNSIITYYTKYYIYCHMVFYVGVTTSLVTLPNLL